LELMGIEPTSIKNY